MIPELKKLILLQEKDKRIAELKKELKRWPAAEAQAQQRAHDAAAATEAAHRKLQEAEVALKSIELDVETRRTTIGRLKVQQFETRKNEEFRAIATEIERYTAEVDAGETKELLMMETIDGLRATWETAKAKEKTVREEVDADLAIMAKRKANDEESLRETQAQRDVAEMDLDEELRERYNLMARNKNGTVVVPVSHGVCGGCHMKVTLATVHALKHYESLLYCDQCGRMIYPDHLTEL